MIDNPEPPKARLLLSPENTSVTLAPGTKKSLKFTITSQEAGEDLFEVSVKGIPVEWVALDNRVVKLKPAERAEFELTISIPESPDIRPGHYAFTIQAYSQNDRSITASAPGELTVAVFQSEGRVGIMLSQVNFVGSPGNRVIVPLLLENRGLIADTFRLEQQGLPAAWITSANTLLHLDPGEQKEIEFSILPPRTPDSVAGRRPFTILIFSQAAPNQPEKVECGLTLAAYFAFGSQLSPQTVELGSPSVIRVQNEGNLPDVYSLEWLSEGNSLKFEKLKRETVAGAPAGSQQTRVSYSEITAPEVVHLAPGKIASVEFRALPRRQPLIGGEFTFPFSFRIQSSNSKKIATHTGAVHGRALFPLWLPVAVGVLLLALICAGLATAYGGLNQASRAAKDTQTSLAQLQGATTTAVFLQTQLAMASQTALVPVTGLTDTPTLTATPTPTGTAQPTPTTPPTGTAPPSPTTAPSSTAPPPTASLVPPTPTTAPSATTASTATTQPPALSGTIVFQSNRNGNIGLYVLNTSAFAVTRLTQDPSPDIQPALSPDGNSVAYVGIQAGNNDIFVTGLDHRTPVDLTNNPANDQQPAWSPDGSMLAFTTNRDGNNEIYIMHADGSQLTNLTNNPADDSSPTWFQTGNLFTRQDWIAFTSNRSGTRQIYIMKPDGSGLRRLTNDTANDYSPSGSNSQIAFVSDRDGNQEVYVMNLDGTNQVNLTNNSAPDYAPVFSPDGQWIAFTSERDGNPELYVMRKDGSNLYNLTRNPAQDSYPSWR
jgi:Tol biopolymer transport system component